MAYVPPVGSSIAALATPSSIPAKMGATDQKTASVGARVLEVIRRYMPIGSLFRPELKIDLSQFVKDQQLFHRIAQFLNTLSPEDWDAETIAKKCATTDLGAELNGLFTSIYLPLLWKACADALTSPGSSSSKLNEAIEGRIFTLKNALIAQQKPALIISSQTQNKLVPQSEKNIKEEGANFIRDSLHFHLLVLKGSEVPFKEELRLVATQLIPFTRRITCSYLREHGVQCPDDPLMFRNPVGLNAHGYFAAMIMEASLNALGYQTRLLMRSDLEPKVTLATLNTLIEITSSQGTCYFIDPCYIQFFKDIYTAKDVLPTTPLLLLEETELDPFIEEKILTPWKANYQRYRSSESELIKELVQNDQYLAYAIKDMIMLENNVPANIEEWIRKSFQRIWKPQGYVPVLQRHTFQELFFGNGPKTATYQLIKSLAIHALTTDHLSVKEVMQQLDQLLVQKTLHRKNNPQALHLIGQLPFHEREKFSDLLDVDLRNKEVDITIKAYYRSLRAMVNPQGKNLKALYACAGADCSSILLATDATELIFVDMTPVTLSEFQEAVAISSGAQTLGQFLTNLNESDDYIRIRRKYLAGISKLNLKQQHRMNQLPFKLLFDIMQLSAKPSGIIIGESNGAIQISFPWQYLEGGPVKTRTLLYIQGDITKPNEYPSTLRTKLQQGIDVFYLKGGFTVPQFYPQFLPTIAKSIRPQGWLMTADKTFSMDTYDPTACLSEHAFKAKKSETTACFEELIQTPFDPFVFPQTLKMFPPNMRRNRSAGTDLSYWTFLNCRQKVD